MKRRPLRNDDHVAQPVSFDVWWENVDGSTSASVHRFTDLPAAQSAWQQLVDRPSMLVPAAAAVAGISAIEAPSPTARPERHEPGGESVIVRDLAAGIGTAPSGPTEAAPRWQATARRASSCRCTARIKAGDPIYQDAHTREWICRSCMVPTARATAPIHDEKATAWR